MRNLSHYLAVLSAVLWVGGMWVVAYLAVPTLFQVLLDRQLAGLVAGRMFTAMAWVGFGCALYLLLYQGLQYGRLVLTQKVFLVTLMMVFLLAVGQFVFQPMMADLKLQALPLDVMHSALAARFKTLHGVASIFYLAQSLLGLALLILLLGVRKQLNGCVFFRDKSELVR
jgi:uncharacterized membrane protein